jgi:hypothetical protein
MQNNRNVVPPNCIVLRSHGGVEQTTRSQNFRRRNLQRDAASNVLGVILGAVGVPMAGTIANIGTTAVDRTYTRDEEREAD